MKVMFDVDGVLIDGWHAEPELRRPWDLHIERDLGIDRQAFQAAFFGSPTGGEASPMAACLRGERDLKQALADVLPAIGHDGDVDALVDYWLARDANVNQALLAIVTRLMRHDHVQTYVVTAQEHYRAAHLWDALGFGTHFSGMYYTAQIGHLKTAPAFFAAINTALDIGPDERPLFFDDKKEVVAQAGAAGWDACIYRDIDDVVMHPRLRDLL